MLSVSPNFNPRSYKRSDVKKVYRCIMFSLFQSTLLQEERRCMNTIMYCVFIFQSTLLQEERPVTAAMSAKLGDISIHAPTRGATLLMGCMLMILLISIHAPTRGATLFSLGNSFVSKYFNPRSYKRSDSKNAQ